MVDRIKEANARLPDKEQQIREKEIRIIKGFLIRNSRRRAKQLGVEHTIKHSDIDLVEYCPILGLKLSRNKGKVDKASYSLDRIDGTKGYVPGNVRVISYWANVLKSNLTKEQIKNLYEYVKDDPGCVD